MSSNLQAFSTFQANPKQPILAPRLSDSQTRKKSCFRSLFPGFRVKSLTFFISILHCLIFIASEIYAYKLNSNDESDVFQCILYKFGALYTPSVLNQYQVFRLITSSLLHAKIYQVLVTTLSLWMTAFKLESVYGSNKFFIFYLLTNLSGSLFSAIIEPNTMVVGPSGVAGLLALSLAYLIENWERIERKQRIRTAIFDVVLIALNIALAIIMTNNTLYSFLGIFLLNIFVDDFQRRIYCGSFNGSFSYKNRTKEGVNHMEIFFLLME